MRGDGGAALAEDGAQAGPGQGALWGGSAGSPSGGDFAAQEAFGNVWRQFWWPRHGEVPGAFSVASLVRGPVPGPRQPPQPSPSSPRGWLCCVRLGSSDPERGRRGGKLWVLGSGTRVGGLCFADRWGCSGEGVGSRQV